MNTQGERAWGSTENYIPTMQLCEREREREGGGGGEGEGERDVSAVTELHVIHCIHPLHIYYNVGSLVFPWTFCQLSRALQTPTE